MSRSSTSNQELLDTPSEAGMWNLKLGETSVNKHKTRIRDKEILTGVIYKYDQRKT